MIREVRAKLTIRPLLAALIVIGVGFCGLGWVGVPWTWPAAAGSPAAAAVPDDAVPDHDDALKARARGEIKSLEEIIQTLKVHKFDRLVDVQIYRRDHRWIYEVTWLTKAGRYRIFTVDAARAVVLKDEVR